MSPPRVRRGEFRTDVVSGDRVDATRDATDAPRAALGAATDRLIFNARCSNARVGCGDGGGDDDDGGGGDEDDDGDDDNGDRSVDAWSTFLSSFHPFLPISFSFPLPLSPGRHTRRKILHPHDATLDRSRRSHAAQ